MSTQQIAIIVLYRLVRTELLRIPVDHNVNEFGWPVIR